MKTLKSLFCSLVLLVQEYVLRSKGSADCISNSCHTSHHVGAHYSCRVMETSAARKKVPSLYRWGHRYRCWGLSWGLYTYIHTQYIYIHIYRGATHQLGPQPQSPAISREGGLARTHICRLLDQQTIPQKAFGLF